MTRLQKGGEGSKGSESYSSSDGRSDVHDKYGRGEHMLLIRSRDRTDREREGGREGRRGVSLRDRIFPTSGNDHTIIRSLSPDISRLTGEDLETLKVTTRGRGVDILPLFPTTFLIHSRYRLCNSRTRDLTCLNVNLGLQSDAVDSVQLKDSEVKKKVLLLST